MELETKALRFFIASLQAIKCLPTAVQAPKVKALDQVVYPFVAHQHHFTHRGLQIIKRLPGQWPLEACFESKAVIGQVWLFLVTREGLTVRNHSTQKGGHQAAKRHRGQALFFEFAADFKRSGTFALASGMDNRYISVMQQRFQKPLRLLQRQHATSKPTLHLALWFCIFKLNLF